MTSSTPDRAHQLLVQALGPDAAFRDGQLEAVLAVVDERRRVLVVERTGWGKSLVYFLATRLLRDHGAGPALLVSPLLALMRDQLRAAERIGVRAETINSTNQERWREVEQLVRADQVDLLLVSPERLGSADFTELVAALPHGLGLFVVDEAHCISDWGHDFRPDYRRIGRIVRALPEGVALLGTTATANDRVVADIEEQLGPGVRVVRGALTRESLRLQVIELPDQASRLAWLAEHVPELPGAGIVYVLTVADAERVSAWLTARGVDAPAYHGDLPGEQREELERRLRHNEVKALVATVALGMGFDKPDLGFVVHYQRPGSAVAYYQQIGRAGRALDDARVVLLAGAEDDAIADFFLRAAFPGEDVLHEVLTAIEQATGGRTLRELEAVVNVRHGKLQQSLKLLEVDGAIRRERSRYVRTPAAWQPDVERFDRVRAERRREQERMRAFVRGDACLMEFLARELDDPDARPCGRCARCAGPFVAETVSDDLAREALRFLRRGDRPIRPRQLWPSGLEQPRGRIREGERLDEGRALSVAGDAGWGGSVTSALAAGEPFSDELVAAAVELVERRWRPAPPPRWVTAVPSGRRPDPVTDLGRRIAAGLGLPFHAALARVRESEPQRTMQNSAQQVANIHGAFAVESDAIEAGAPVLLVDDVIDSGWTLTLCGVVLRRAGAGPVLPLALAARPGRES